LRAAHPKWRWFRVSSAKDGGREVSKVKRLQSLRDENRRVNKLRAETMLDSAILKDLASRNW
jgi:putative transposase